jgi:hypothetical protein
VKLYFAGTENVNDSYRWEPLPTDNLFCTFFYATRTSKLLQKLAGKHKGLITIDSGAHSFFGYAGISTQTHHNKKQHGKSKMPCPIRYFDQYLYWLKRHEHLFDYFVELDIQAIVGFEKVRFWRRKLERLNLWHKCIPVLHSCDTNDEMMETISDCASKYVGFEGLRDRKVNIPYMKLLDYCYKRNVRTHGFALTNNKILEAYPFYSADSTTWTSTVRYGSFMVFDRGMKIVQKPPTRRNYLKNRINPGIFNTVKDEQTSRKKLEHSASVLRKAEVFLTTLWESRGVKWQDLKKVSASRT